MLKQVLSKMLRQLAEFNTGFLSKAQACEYLNISRSTFDKMIKEGKIPKGKKRQGFKELSWTKEQLNFIKQCS